MEKRISTCYTKHLFIHSIIFMPSIVLGIMYKSVNKRKNSLCSHKAYIIVRRKKMKEKHNNKWSITYWNKCYEYKGQDTERLNRLNRWEAAKVSQLALYCLDQGTCHLIGSQPKNIFINWKWAFICNLR